MENPDLKQFASLWTLLHYPNGSECDEWSYDQKLAEVKAAGFDGFQWFPLPELSELMAKHELAFLGCCTADQTNYKQCLDAFASMNPIRINVQLGDSTMQPAEAARLWITLNEMANDLDLALDLETHRGTCTETPERTWQIADIYEQHTSHPIQLTFDFSHFAVVRHHMPPYAEFLMEKGDLLLASRQMHLRPFNAHHCEIPATDSRGEIAQSAKPWFDFVEALFVRWSDGQPNKSEALWVCPEIGAMTSGYWLPSFPDPWKDALFVRREVERLWRKTVCQQAASAPPFTTNHCQRSSQGGW